MRKNIIYNDCNNKKEDYKDICIKLLSRDEKDLLYEFKNAAKLLGEHKISPRQFTRTAKEFAELGHEKAGRVLRYLEAPQILSVGQMLAIYSEEIVAGIKIKDVKTLNVILEVFKDVQKYSKQKGPENLQEIIDGVESKLIANKAANEVLNKRSQKSPEINLI